MLRSMLCASTFGTPFCLAQNPTTPPDLHPNPMLALRAFEPAATEEYLLGRGDEISLDFGSRTELNGKRIVGPDGRITLPMAGSVQVADKSREEAAAAILAALAPYYTHLAVTVGVEKYTSNRVLVLGAVQHPGIITFDTPPTLLEVITRGGVLGGGSDSLAKLPPIPERCAIYRGSDKVLWVDLKALLNSGNALADIRLRRDDVVYVPSLQDRTVSILGHVNHPGSVQLDSTSTLAKLIAESGGISEDAGSNPKIRIISPKTGTTRIIAFKSILQPGPVDLTLNPGDIIFVPQTGFDKFSYVLTKLSPLVSFFTAFAYLEQ
jgi:polysaccharide export outer membrane protein